MLLDTVKKTFQKLERPTVDDIKEAIESLGGLLSQTTKFITEPPIQLAYGRNVIYRSEHVEVVIIHVPPQKNTTIHDHGESIGCAVVVEGELSNVTYKLMDGIIPRQDSEHIVSQNQYFIAPKGQIHEIQNRKNERLISLHVYSPPLSQNKSYAPYEEILDYVI